MIKNLPANVGDARDAGSITGSGRSPGVRNGTPLQQSGLENFLGKGPENYRRWGCEESDVAGQARTLLSCTR